MAARTHARELLPDDRHDRWVAALCVGSLVAVRGIGVGTVVEADDDMLVIRTRDAARVRLPRELATARLRPLVSGRRIRALVAALADGGTPEGRHDFSFRTGYGRKRSVLATGGPDEWAAFLRARVATTRRAGAQTATFAVLGGETGDAVAAIADELARGDAASFEHDRQWVRGRFIAACARDFVLCAQT